MKDLYHVAVSTRFGYDDYYVIADGLSEAADKVVPFIQGTETVQEIKQLTGGGREAILIRGDNDG